MKFYLAYQASAVLIYLARSTWETKNQGSWVITGLYNDTTRHRCYSTSFAERSSSRLWTLLNCHIWPVGLVAWFSLRVREVPGSTPGQAPCIVFCQNILQAGTAWLFWFSLLLPFWMQRTKRSSEGGKANTGSEKDTLFPRQSLGMRRTGKFDLPLICLPYTKSSLNVF